MTGGVGTPGVLWESSNFGLNWADTPALDETAYFEDVAYLAGGRRVAVGTRKPSDQPGFVASSLGAAPWALAFDWPVTLDANLDPLPNKAEMSAIDAASGGTVAWTVGSDWAQAPEQSPAGPFRVVVYKTTDSGSTWTNQTPTATSPQSVTCVSAANAQTAFIGRRHYTLLRTTTGGASWLSISLGDTSISSVNAIDSLDADRMLVVGNTAAGVGRIRYTATASAATPTWIPKALPAGTKSLYGAKMFDATHWIVVGDNETILRTSDAGLHWTGPNAVTLPTAVITSSSGAADTVVAGTSNDGAGIGVAKVEVRIQRMSPTTPYWNGAAWVASPDTWIQANRSNPANGWDNWSATAVLPVGTSGLTVSARATDGLGSVGPVAAVGAGLATQITLAKTSYVIGYGTKAAVTGSLKTTTGEPIAGKRVTIKSGSYIASANTAGDGSFILNVGPSSKATYSLGFAATPGFSKAPDVRVVVLPRARIDRPVVAKTRTHTKAFKTYVSLFPRHTKGTPAIKFTFQRREKVRGHYVWVGHGTFSAKAVNYKSWTRCTVSRKLLKGSWHVQAMHADAGHSKSLSAWKSFTVK